MTMAGQKAVCSCTGCLSSSIWCHWHLEELQLVSRSRLSGAIGAHTYQVARPALELLRRA